MIDATSMALPANLPDEMDVTRWLAAHEELVRHWEDEHGTKTRYPCAACLPLLHEEALRFARVERLAADGVSLALEGLP